MRQRNTRQLAKDYTDELIRLIHRISGESVPCFRSTLVSRLRTQSALTHEQTERVLDAAIRQHRVVELYDATNIVEPVCHDLRSLK